MRETLTISGQLGGWDTACLITITIVKLSTLYQGKIWDPNTNTLYLSREAAEEWDAIASGDHDKRREFISTSTLITKLL